MSPVDRARQILATGERDHIVADALVLTYFRIGTDALVRLTGGDTALIRAGRIAGKWDAASTVSISFDRRLRGRSSSPVFRRDA